MAGHVVPDELPIGDQPRVAILAVYTVPVPIDRVGAKMPREPSAEGRESSRCNAIAWRERERVNRGERFVTSSARWARVEGRPPRSIPDARAWLENTPPPELPSERRG